MTDLVLQHGLSFADLYHRDGLARLDAAFMAHLQAADASLFALLAGGRAAPEKLAAKDESDLIVDVAPHLEDFIAALFGIQTEVLAHQSQHDELSPLYTVKRLFVQRRAAKGATPDVIAKLDGAALAAKLEELMGEKLTDRSFATHVAHWLNNEAQYSRQLDTAAQYAAWATHSAEGKKLWHDSILFKIPHRLDMNRLVPVTTIVHEGVTMLHLPDDHHRHREGFALTDPGMDLIHALDHANYCIWCHNQGKDSCSHGMKDKKAGGFASTVFGVTLNGCPLEEKISEMNLVKARGNSIGAMAIAAIDNPMMAGTGHRICNDCMKACIYQKQDPVDIPQVETRTLKDVLAMPWGFEIYSLLTRWNPLDLRRPIPKPESGYKVLVVGLGPAGFTLAHHLMNDGHHVVGIDGLKIEPLPQGLAGKDFRPIRSMDELRENLDDRVMAGFGGVAEYGITVRWDKNFLKVIRLLIERRAQFAMYGGVRFGGTITIDDAFAMGFDHIALCAGAGRPTVVPMKNGLARGVRQASDFLMALQLTGAAKTSSLANLTVRLPIVVIGGGLTAIDTATESLAYYPVQVEKFLTRYETLVAERGEAAVRASWNEEDKEVAAEFIAHAKAIREERAAAARENREPKIGKLLDQWGGSTMAYRRRLIDAPSYTLNHEEVAKAMEEGIRFAECLAPEEVKIDRFGHAEALVLLSHKVDATTGKIIPTGEHVTLKARTILVAAGTTPNTVLAREDGQVEIDGRFFQAYDEAGNKVKPERVAKPDKVEVLMQLRDDGRAISFFGDLHPSFAGNVVKAMGGAKLGYPVVSRTLAKRKPAAPAPQQLLATLDDELRPRVHAVVALAPKIVEVVVKAPRAARAFHPGQFYRLQNYESHAPKADGTSLTMEGLALTGATVDREKGLLSTIVLEMGGSSDLCSILEPGEPVVLMGPTGTPTETPGGENVVLVGGGLGNAVLLSIGTTLRENGSKVLYFAGYKKPEDRYKVKEIEAGADCVVWCCDTAPGFTPTRSQDKAFVGNIVEAMLAYNAGSLGDQPIKLNTADRLIVIGSDGMMNAVARARETTLKPYLKPGHHAIASINSPMQCMMKEICAQCLQVQKDPVTGEEVVVFSCFNQDQGLDRVDFGSLRQRLTQNSLEEKLTALWIDRCLKQLGMRQAAE
ncbi:MAG TPA: FAD-dependent oxidoreductase [Stellaceae bacterium]|jgi:NADPH-dependent glutamate synthase beta subunit-like oxidoreductase/NAD(P)H-flavin reductase|nr:FAD-dependent oxidoreductase [Stellaceae bacterium]